MTQLLQPGNVVALDGSEPPSQIDNVFAEQTWEGIWPRLCYHYATTGARDAELAGLGPSDSALAYVRDINVLFVWSGTAWKPINRRLTGTVSIPNVAANGGLQQVAVAFPAGMFTSAPRLALAVANTRYQPGFSGLSATGFTFDVSNYTSGTPGTAVTGHWTAEQV